MLTTFKRYVHMRISSQQQHSDRIRECIGCVFRMYRYSEKIFSHCTYTLYIYIVYIPIHCIYKCTVPILGTVHLEISSLYSRKTATSISKFDLKKNRLKCSRTKPWNDRKWSGPEPRSLCGPQSLQNFRVN